MPACVCVRVHVFERANHYAIAVDRRESTKKEHTVPTSQAATVTVHAAGFHLFCATLTRSDSPRERRSHAHSTAPFAMLFDVQVLNRSLFVSRREFMCLSVSSTNTHKFRCAVCLCWWLWCVRVYACIASAWMCNKRPRSIDLLANIRSSLSHACVSPIKYGNFPSLMPASIDAGVRELVWVHKKWAYPNPTVCMCALGMLYTHRRQNRDKGVSFCACVHGALP